MASDDEAPTPLLTWDGAARHPITALRVSARRLHLSCDCGWTKGCRPGSERLHANQHWRSLFPRPDSRADCKRCGRQKCVSVGSVNERLITFCYWARWGLCDWPGPFPPTHAEQLAALDCRQAGEVVRPWVPHSRPPFRPPEDQDDAIRWMVKWRGEGMSTAAIVRALDAGGFRPPMRGGRGGRWNGVTVRRYLAWADGQPLRQWYLVDQTKRLGGTYAVAGAADRGTNHAGRSVSPGSAPPSMATSR